MRGLLPDLRLALRNLARRPGFTAAVVLSLALGIGANTAVFSLVDATLLRPLPVPEPDRLVAIYSTRPGSTGPGGFSVPDVEDFRRELGGTFTELMGYNGVPLSLSGDRAAELVWGERVTAGYFSGLGVEAARGRLFTPADFEGDPGRRLAVLTWSLWQRRFGGDPGVVGGTVLLNGHDYTVVGVAEEGFSGVKFLGFAPEVWVANHAWAGHDPDLAGSLENRGTRSLQLYGRLAPGVGIERAEAAIDAASRRLAAEHLPEAERARRVHLIPGRTKTEPFFHVQLAGKLELAGAVLMAAVGMVLLVACANVANLLLARAADRRREMAVRSAIGGGRWRLARQLLAEGLVLALAGGAAGALLGGWLAELFVLGSPQLDFGIDYGVAMDLRVLGFTFALALVTVLAFGLVPALRESRPAPAAALHGERAAGPAGRRALGFRGVLVAGQVALSLALLVTAGLFVRSFDRARALDPGFETENLLVVSVQPGVLGYSDEDGRRLYREIVERVAALPGVESAAVASPLPLDAYTTSVTVVPAGFELLAGEPAPSVFASAVGPGYFEALGTRLERGRGFGPGDGPEAPRVAVVNRAFAERFWPGGEAVGERFRLGSGADGPEVEVVGVAADGEYLALGEAPRPYLFFPIEQRYSPQVRVAVRAQGDPAALAPSVEAAIRRLDPDLPVYGARSGAGYLERSLAGQRSLAMTAGLFGALSALLAAVGVFGVMSYFVSRRTREIGVRMAFGARRRDVLGLVLRRGLIQTLIGVGLGVGLALGLGQLLAGLLLEVSPRDPLVLFAVPAALTAVALAAAWIPARRASRAEPLAALRHE